MISLDNGRVVWLEALRLLDLIHMVRRAKMAFGSPGCPTVLSATRQVGLFGLRQVTEMPSGCPVAAEQTQHVPFFPQRGANEREEPAEAMAPVGEERQIAQEQIDQQRRDA